MTNVPLNRETPTGRLSPLGNSGTRAQRWTALPRVTCLAGSRWTVFEIRLPRRTYLDLLLLVWVWVLGVSFSGVVAQEERLQGSGIRLRKSEAELARDPVFVHWRADAEVANCGFCHYGPGNAFVERQTDFSSLREAKIWLTEDSHALSAKRIEPIAPADLAARRVPLSPSDPENLWVGESNTISYAICQRLGYDLTTESGWRLFRDNCLTCHGGYRREPSPPPVTGARGQEHLRVAPDARFANLETMPPGIRCSYCHQLGDQTAWVNQHGGFDSASQWRALPPAEKQALGMRHLADAPQQAELCSACHIGDHSQGMFVTHDMYVAGHPPLPSFELQTFLDAMPIHWRTERQTWEHMQDWSGRQAYFQQTYPVASPEDTQWRSRRLLIGALVAAQRYLDLLAEADDPHAAVADTLAQGSRGGPSYAPVQASRWGDYALYDCSACHHELRVPSQRQLRYQAANSVPGRPRLLEWTNPLLEGWLKQADESGTIRELWDQLEDATQAVPFGDRQACELAARAIRQALAEDVTQVSRTSINQQNSRVLLQQLLSPDALQRLDYHSARQVQWAVRVLAAELGAKDVLESMQRTKATATLTLPSARRGNLYRQFATAEVAGTAYLEEQLEQVREFDVEAFSAALELWRRQLSRSLPE